MIVKIDFIIDVISQYKISRVRDGFFFLERPSWNPIAAGLPRRRSKGGIRD
jgi:hypothetical protein